MIPDLTTGDPGNGGSPTGKRWKAPGRQLCGAEGTISPDRHKRERLQNGCLHGDRFDRVPNIFEKCVKSFTLLEEILG